MNYTYQFCINGHHSVLIVSIFHFFVCHKLDSTMRYAEYSWYKTLKRRKISNMLLNLEIYGSHGGIRGNQSHLGCWDVTPHSLRNGYQQFKGVHHLIFRSSQNPRYVSLATSTTKPATIAYCIPDHPC
jgi:hypothetical protein